MAVYPAIGGLSQAWGRACAPEAWRARRRALWQPRSSTARAWHTTGLRNPCAQIERFRPGLLAAVTPRGPDGQVQRLSGVMAVVLEGGSVQPGDNLEVVYWPAEHQSLQPV